MAPSIESSKLRSFATRVQLVVALLAPGALTVVACNAATDAGGTRPGSESHFLMDCDSDSECGGELSCLVGRCSIECDSDTDCTNLLDDSICTSAGSIRSCDLSCQDNDDCRGLLASECTGGACRQPDDASMATDDGSGTATTTDTTDEVVSDVTSDPAADASGTSSAPDGSVPDGGSQPDASLQCTQPASAYEVLGECTVDLDCEMFVDDCGCGCLPEMSSQVADAGASDSGGGGEPVEDPAALFCTNSADCVLATRLDVCCPECEQAFSAAYVAAEACVYAEDEDAPVGCTPSDCTDGCPGAACASAIGALCVGGQCRTAVAESLCGAGTCDAPQYCVESPSGYQCQTEDCDYDSCHPERCDQVGERCCDPLPGDGVVHCNAGLVCGANGCEVPDGIDPNRICNNVLCAEGDVCCDKCTGACVDALSGAACPNDNMSDTVCADAFPCGPELECPKSTHYCESLTAGPVIEPTYSCVELPDACLDAPNCPCLTADGFADCNASPEGGYVLHETAP